MKQLKNWFEDWFDTKYYHILYQDRNDEEAQFFMRNITQFLKLKENSKILDLPCGKGRHAIYLNSLGYDVIGADLSKNSIAYAQQFENDKLHFEVHDMRDEFVTKFDAIFNLFTSFGYFDKEKTNIKVLKNLKKGLNSSGVLVLDFLNIDYVAQHLIDNQVITKSAIDFNITKSITNNFIIKDIEFTADNKQHKHTEYVRNINLEMFKAYFEEAGLKLKHIFGDYNLTEFNKETSKRLILIAE